MKKKRGLGIVFICIFCITTITLTFFNIKKMKEFKTQNNSLKTELQSLKKKNSSLFNENNQLNKNKSHIENKIDEIEKNLR